MCGDLDHAKKISARTKIKSSGSMTAPTAADLARDAFMSSDYELACKLFEDVLAEQSSADSSAGQSSNQSSSRSQRLSLYYGYGDSLARAGRLRDALDVFGHISGAMLESCGGLIPLDRLQHLTSSLVETVLAARVSLLAKPLPSVAAVDPLCCPICEDILRLPVTATCGHTFCRQCCFGHSSCPVCHTRFPTVPSVEAGVGSAGPSSTITLLSLPAAATVTSTAATVSEELAGTSGSSSASASGGKRDSVIGFEQDILIRRLVERWWGPELKAAELNEEAQRYLDDGGGGGDGGEGLDDALRCCNQSLENAPNSYKGLLLRSEVLYRLQHYQSALADADGALKSRPTAHKAHYLRALALSALGKPEAAITAHCVALFLDKQSVCVAAGIKQEIAKDLQQLLAAVGTRREPDLPLALRDPLALLFGTPYSLMSSRKRRHHRILSAHKHKAKKQYASLRTADFDDVDHSDEDEEDSYLRAATLLDEMDDEEGFLRSAMMNPPHHRRKSLTAYNLSFFSTQRQQDRFRRDQQQSAAIIPIRPNPRLRAFVDRMTAELESVRWTAEATPVRLTVSPSAIEPSDFDCVLCCRTLWRPVVTPCGHTYCWVCLDRCMDYSPSCPLCMAPLIEQFRHHHQRTPNLQTLLATAAASNPTLISLSKRKVTAFVEQAMQRFIPDAYEKRQRQELDREPTVPVFICTTAFPSVPCPLFVYEPRYKLMVRRAIESGERQFGIALPQSGRQRYVEYGTMLDIRDCVQLGDGCSILSTVGSRRFRVIARHEQDGYDTANVEFIQDEPDSGWEVVRKLHEKVHEKAIGWHDSLQERKKSEIAKSFGRMPTLEENWERLVDGPAWAWWIIAILPLSEQLKVNILSTTSLEKRLRAIDKTLNLAPQKQRRSPVYVVPSSPASPPPVGCCDGVVVGVTSGVTPSLHHHHQQQHAHHQSPHQHQSQQHHDHLHHHHHEQCQAIDCCLRERTTSADSADRNSSGDHLPMHHHHHHNHHHHPHHQHLSQSADAGDYLL